ncbi:unnamed protein product [Merluccius merluccius]
MALTQDTILTFLLERGGRVRNADLLSRFRSHLTDPAGNQQRQQHNRDAFKALVNGVAVVRRVDGVNFVVAKKRYRDFAKEEEEDTTSTGADPDPSSPRTAASPHGAAAATRGRTEPGSSNLSGRNLDDAVRHHSDICISSAQKSAVPPVGTDDSETSLKVLNISSDRVGRTGESGAVFAVISVNSPPRDPDYTTPERRRPPLRVQSLALTAPVPTRFGPTGPLERTKRSAAAQSCENLAALNGSPAAAVRPQTRRGDDPPSESVPLDPVGHEWLVKSGAGMWRHVYGLLLLDARLATRRDFMSGFTALHWAAKEGNGDMVRKMMDVSRGNGGARLDVNGKTHGGYTPLHIAAIHGHGDVMALLVQGYGARVNVRDNAGKRPHHYLVGPHVTAELKELLGAGGTGGKQQACRDQAAGMDEEEEDGGYKEQPKGLNSTISKLFQPHIMGHRKKHQRQQQQPPGSAIWDGF